MATRIIALSVAAASVGCALASCQQRDARESVAATQSAVISDGEATGVYGQDGSFTSATANLSGISAESLAAPSAALIDDTGRLYVADQANHRVLSYPVGSRAADLVYGQGGSFVDNTMNAGGISASSLDAPAGLAFEAAGDSDAGSSDAGGGATVNLYVADSGNHRILFFPAGSTTATRVYGQSGSFTTADPGSSPSADTLFQPNGLAVDGNGNLFVADALSHRVLRYPAGSTTADRVYGQLGDFTTRVANKSGLGADSLKNPTDVAIDATGGLFIADTGNWRVLHYSGSSTTADRVYGQGGSFVVALPNNGGISKTSLNLPQFVTSQGGDLWVSDSSNNRVLRFPGSSTTADRVLGQLGSFTTASANAGGIGARSLRKPVGLAFNAAGDLFVGDSLNHRVLELAKTCATVGCDDGNDCTDDTCEANGVCTHAPTATPPVSCGGYRCDSTTLECKTSCTDAADCASTHSCILGRCTRMCADSTECADGEPCVNGWCCNNGCPGTCQACNVAGSEGTCVNALAGDDPNGVCRGFGCSGSGSCLLSCAMNDDCADGFVCNTGICTRQCATNDDCNGADCIDGACCSRDSCDEGYTCNYDPIHAGTCWQADGTSCDDGPECGSGLCVDGLCCDTDCLGVCVACNLPGTEGTCTPIEAGTDPDDECPTSAPVCGGQCDGQGACLAPAAAGVVCSERRCEDGLLLEPAECDGTGAPCPAASGTPCPGAFGCTDDGTECRTSCTLASHCAAGANCVGGECITQVATRCSGPADCESGSCADGFCCNSPCDGLCQRCDLQGRVGVCSPIARGEDPDVECSEGDPCLGVCDGNSGCAPAAAGTLCRAGSCASTSAAQPPAVCRGDGQPCEPQPVEDCGPGLCSANATCSTSCDTDANCAPGAECRSGGRCAFPAADAGCGCRIGPERGPSKGWLALLVALPLVRRKRQRARL